jgi:ketol-acid reductoisomerase
MASIARSASQSLRAVSRRAPSALAKAAVKPAQTASYSLLARAAAAKAAQRAPVQVSHENYGKWEAPSNQFSRVLAV